MCVHLRPGRERRKSRLALNRVFADSGRLCAGCSDGVCTYLEEDGDDDGGGGDDDGDGDDVVVAMITLEETERWEMMKRFLP